jgi:hypothetical protein
LNDILVAAPLAGKMSDIYVIRWKKRRGGIWYPEDRLRAAISGAMFLVPLTMIASGLLVEHVPGRVGLVLNLICLFLNGFGVCVASWCSIVRIFIPLVRLI